MNEMNILTLNGTQYEIADKKAREEVAGKASKAYVDKTFAPAIPVTMTGTAVSTDMVSPVEHEVECRVSSDNIANPNDFSRTSGSGVSLSISDGKIILSGTAQGENIFAFPQKGYYILPHSGDYYLSGGINSSIYLQGKDTSDNNYFDRGNGVKVNPSNREIRWNLRIASGTVCDGKAIQLQLKNSSTLQPYTPYVPDLTAVTVSRIGNNKLNLNNYSGDVSGTYTGWLVNPEGKTGRLLLFDKNNGADISGIYFGTTKTGIDASEFDWAIAKGVLEKTEISSNYKYVSIHPKGEASIKKLLARFDVMYTLGDSNVYEPYKGQDYHPSPDGTVSGMKSISPSMTILTDSPGATVTATYNADTKRYIDNKFAELQALTLENGGV